MGKYVFANGAAGYSKNGSTEFQLFGSTGLAYSEGVPLRFGSGYSAVTAGSSEGSTMTAYGVTKITATAGANSSALTCYLAAPSVGVMKTLIVESTADLAGNLNIDLGAGVVIAAGTSNASDRYITFSTAGQMQSLTLIGLTTAQWGLVASNSTMGEFGVATAIRSSSSFSS